MNWKELAQSLSAAEASTAEVEAMALSGEALANPSEIKRAVRAAKDDVREAEDWIKHHLARVGNCRSDNPRTHISNRATIRNMPAYPIGGGVSIGGAGELYRLGPETNAFATAAARDTYARNENNAGWLRQYIANKRLATIQGAPGDAGPYYAVDEGGITDRLWVASGGSLQAWDAASGAREAGDISLSGISYTSVWSAAANTTRVYVLTENSAGGGTVDGIHSFAFDGTRHSNEDAALGQTPGSNDNWNGVAATDGNIYVLWTTSNNLGGGVRVYGTGANPTEQSTQTLSVANMRDISATSTRIRILTDNSVLSYNASWAAQTAENLTLPGGRTYQGISEHGGELFVLSSDGIHVYRVTSGSAPTDTGRTIRATGTALAARYDASSVTWIQVLGTGVAGQTGPRGPAASVNANTVTSAIDTFSPTQVQTVLGDLGLTGPEIVQKLDAVTAGARLDYQWLDDKPTVISANERAKLSGIENNATADLTGAEIVALLQALAAGSRLEYQYVDGTPSLADFRTEAQIETLIHAAQQAAVTGNTETGIISSWDGTTDKYIFTITRRSTPQTHSLWVAYGATQAQEGFGGGDFEDATRGATATGTSITMPTYTGYRHFAIAVPTTEELVSVEAVGFLGNLLDDMEKETGTVSISSTNAEVWVSDNAVNISGAVLTITTRSG